MHVWLTACELGDDSWVGCRRLFNIFHPADPIAYRFEPLLDSKYGQIPAALLPIRGTHAKGSTATHQPQTQTTATTTTKTSEQPHDAERNASETEKKVSEIADADGTDRIDIVLQKAASDGYSQYVSSLTFAAHWCYWDNKSGPALPSLRLGFLMLCALLHPPSFPICPSHCFLFFSFVFCFSLMRRVSWPS